MTPVYTVIWKRSLVERELAGLIVSLMERGQSILPITNAMDEIDRRLAADPLTEGESRTEFERVLIVTPLTVVYEVHDEEKVVYVFKARYATPRET